MGAMILELGKFLKLGSGNGWNQPARDEWMDGVAAELRDFPYEIVMDAIVAARKAVRWPQEFVVWVCNEIRPAVERLRLEESRLDQLLEIAGG